MKDIDWPFEDAYNIWVFTLESILHEGKPILYVSHDEDDGTWQFLDGSNNPKLEDARIIGLGQAVKLDPTLKSLADLPLGWYAWREGKGTVWIREKHD